MSTTFIFTDNTVCLWDTRKLKNAKNFLVRLPHTKAVTSAMFSPSGLRLASASYDDYVRIWSLQDEKVSLSLSLSLSLSDTYSLSVTLFLPFFLSALLSSLSSTTDVISLSLDLFLVDSLPNHVLRLLLVAFFYRVFVCFTLRLTIVHMPSILPYSHVDAHCVCAGQLEGCGHFASQTRQPNRSMVGASVSGPPPFFFVRPFCWDRCDAFIALGVHALYMCVLGVCFRLMFILCELFLSFSVSLSTLFVCLNVCGHSG